MSSVMKKTMTTPAEPMPLKRKCHAGGGNKEETSLVKWRYNNSMATSSSSLANNNNDDDGGDDDDDDDDDVLLRVVDDDLWITIFGFLVGPSGDFTESYKSCLEFALHHSFYEERNFGSGLVWLKAAKQIHSDLTAVCKTWRRICNTNMRAIFGKINANLDVLSFRDIVPYLHWMIRHRVAIGALNFKADYGDLPFLKRLLDVCDTSELAFVRAHCIPIHNDPTTSGSRWIAAAYHSFERRGFIEHPPDGLTPVSFRQKCERLGIPYNSCPNLWDLHETIGNNCGNLSELQVHLDVPNGASAFLQHRLPTTLFSSNRLIYLELIIVAHSDLSVIVRTILERLVNLQELALGFPNHHHGRHRRIHLESKALRSLDVRGVGMNNWISGNLPNLETLRYCGCWSGLVPRFESPSVERLSRENGSRSDVGIRFRAGEADLPNLNLPPGCEIFGDHYYDLSASLFDAFRNAGIG